MAAPREYPNLTRAGKGQPRKGKIGFHFMIDPVLDARIEAIAEKHKITKTDLVQGLLIQGLNGLD